MRRGRLRWFEGGEGAPLVCSYGGGPGDPDNEGPGQAGGGFGSGGDGRDSAPSRASPGGGYHGPGGALSMGYHGTGPDLGSPASRAIQAVIGSTLAGRIVGKLTGYDFSKGLGPAFASRYGGTGNEEGGAEPMMIPGPGLPALPSSIAQRPDPGMGGLYDIPTGAPAVAAPAGLYDIPSASVSPVSVGSASTAEFGELMSMGRQQWDAWKQHGLGSLVDITRKVRDYANPGRIAMEEGLAATKVGAAYGKQKETLMRSLARRGINPASGRFTSALRSLMLGQAADTAGAQVQARRGILDRGIEYGMRIPGLWQGVGDAASRMVGTAAKGLTAIREAALSRKHQAALAAQRVSAMARESALGRAHQSYLDERRTAAMSRESALGRAHQLHLAKLGREHDITLAKMGSKDRSKAGLWGAIGQLGGSALTAWMLKSDRRTKQDIVEIDCFPNGLRVYEFRFKDEPEVLCTGLMADEVEALMPHHVVELDGVKHVDYAGVIGEMICHG